MKKRTEQNTYRPYDGVIMEVGRRIGTIARIPYPTDGDERQRALFMNARTALARIVHEALSGGGHRQIERTARRKVPGSYRTHLYTEPPIHNPSRAYELGQLIKATLEANPDYAGLPADQRDTFIPVRRHRDPARAAELARQYE